MCFQYPETDMTRQRNMWQEVKEQIIKSSRISGKLHDTIWRNKNMGIKAKMKIYKTCGRVITTYPAERRADTSITK